ncbi:FAD-dependent monooxygenase [Isoalcanivorax indicus]|uniref:FAD-dependent monooxygenase n=1 Tax=Isoalcanivorax indicus TaxID=2202653 RepID=UPI000DB9DFD4|nr:FAD-dependent monooxygenase [Isoalcanivorax indicus]
MSHQGIVIVGGGMAGLALALLWRRAGQPSVTLVEAAPLAEGGALDTPSFDARSTALSAGSLALLASLGLEDTLLSRAASILSVDVSRRGRLGQTRIRAEEEGLPRLGAVVENRWLGQVLLEAARRDEGLRLIAPATVNSVRRQAGGYAVTLTHDSSPTTLTCALLVAADGARSRVRDAMAISARHHDLGHDALIANVALGQAPAAAAGVAWERFLDTGPLALLPLPQARMALVWTGPRAFIDELAALDEAALLARLQGAFGEDRLGRFARIGERQRYPLILTEACAQYVPHGVVVGNAAHSLHPVAGQGFNLTLRDLARLADTLGDTGTPGDIALLQRYAEGRAADQALIRQASRWVPELFRVRFGPFAHTRQLGLVALDILPGLRSGFAARAMGLANGG